MRLRSGSEAVTVSGTGIRLEAEDRTSLEVGLDGVRLAADGTVVEVGTDGLRDLPGDLDVELRSGRVVITLASSDLFSGPAPTSLSAAGARRLAEVATLARQAAAGQIDVVAHTDATGTEQEDLERSELQALAVLRWLRDREGIPGEVLRASGLGSSRPSAGDGRADPSARAGSGLVEISFAVDAGHRR